MKKKLIFGQKSWKFDRNFRKKIEAGGIFRSIITSIKGIYDILDDTIAPKV